MKILFIKILCWVAGIGAVGYIGLTIANSVPSINQLVGAVPFIGQIPTPIIEPIAESIYDCKSHHGENAETVRISDAPKSEGSYPRWECVVKNPNASEEEYQEYLVELKKYKEWPRSEDFDIDKYSKASCKYYDGIWYDGTGPIDEIHGCVNPSSKDYEQALERLEHDKQFYNMSIIDYSKE